MELGGGSKHSETPINFYETTRRNIPVDSHLYVSLKSTRKRSYSFFVLTGPDRIFILDRCLYMDVVTWRAPSQRASSLQEQNPPVERFVSRGDGSTQHV
jgi:hypothetical protein